MKIEKMMKLAGVAACVCLAFSLTARAEEGGSTNAPAKHHGGQGLHRGAGAGGGELGGGENREALQKFRESLKDMTPEQRQEAIKKFTQKMSEKFKERLEQNTKLTAEQKKEILGHMEKMQAEREKIMKDSSLTEEQKREALQKLREKAREIFEKHREALGGGQHKEGGPAKAGGQQPVEAKPSV